MRWAKKFVTDRAKLKRDLKDVGARLKALKAEIRESSVGPTKSQGGELVQAKIRATILCCIAAWSRGKQHCKVTPELAYVASVVWDNEYDANFSREGGWELTPDGLIDAAAKEEAR